MLDHRRRVPHGLRVREKLILMQHARELEEDPEEPLLGASLCPP